MSDATDPATIDSVLRETRVFPPPAGFAARASISGRAQYDALYRRSVDDPEGFWAEMATRLRIISPPPTGRFAYPRRGSCRGY